MDFFRAADGTKIAFHRRGEGPPLICVPGGPMRASAYLGGMGGLDAHRTLIQLDPRGTGDSDTPDDPASYDCRVVAEDIEALRLHLGLDRLDLAGHSAGAAVAVHYAARHPHRIAHLALLNPSPRVINLEITNEDRREVAQLRRDEPWFPSAYAALERIWSGTQTDADWSAIDPFNYGRWDEIARADAAIERNEKAAALYYGASGTPDLFGVFAPVLLITGEYDLQIPPRRLRSYAAKFPNATQAVAPGAAHTTWLDAPEWFVRTMTAFL
ncbi:alpha/beta fold hydrolase [Actinoplanes sp. CA-142083]|uniref:alpha/beta fold hydrolase n=1 Tax=Actinoplanes sp. CA-142083 TaxID=3239903 RepID=UPI003D8D4206